MMITVMIVRHINDIEHQIYLFLKIDNGQRQGLPMAGYSVIVVA